MSYSYIPRINQPNTPNLSSLQLSSRWAMDASRGTIPQMASPLRVHTGGQLAGTHFFSGRVHDPQSQRYNDLMTARTIAAGGTLNAYHVNLESNVGQYLKHSMDLPFQQHSRVDPMKAALQAPKTLEEMGVKGGMAGSMAMSRAGLGPATTESLIQQQMRKMAPALQTFQGEIEKPIGAGVSSLALQMKSGDILKLSTESIGEGFGSRPFDVPMLRSGTIAGDTPVHFMVQPKVDIARTPDEAQRFFGALRGAGYSVWDPGERQFGYYKGKAVLVDYDAVTARAGAPIKELAAESLSRSSIEGRAIGAAVRSPMEAAEKIAAKETLHELHTNLESGVGQFLKKVMRLPFKGHSRVDPMAAASPDMGEGGIAGKFSGKALTIGGLVLAGALTAGYAMGHHKSDSTQVSRMSHTETPYDRKRHEERRDNTRSSNQERKPPKTRTRVELTDHPWDMATIDQAYANKLRYGYAHSS